MKEEPMLPGFYRFVREERHFCTILVHLLLQKNGNLARFLDLTRTKLGGPQSSTKAEDGAEIYTEFSFLRDDWNRRGRDNVAKRRRILELLDKGGLLVRVESSPEEISAFNEFFMGPRGALIIDDIAYPGSWSVAALRERYPDQPTVFRDLCRFKWSFNIKPDLVIVVPGSKALCIEAKLESKEGQYPANLDERRIFDEMLGVEKGRVQQVDLQRFMFETLLGVECEFLTVGRRAVTRAGDLHHTPFITWQEAFGSLDLSGSSDYVTRIIHENVHLAKP